MFRANFSADKPETFFINNVHHLDLGIVAAMGFFTHCSDWFLYANKQQRNIRIVVDYDPVRGYTKATFSAPTQGNPIQ